MSISFQEHSFIKLESSKYMIVLAGYMENEVYGFISTFAIITFVSVIRINFILCIYRGTMCFTIMVCILSNA